MTPHPGHRHRESRLRPGAPSRTHGNLPTSLPPAAGRTGRTPGPGRAAGPAAGVSECSQGAALPGAGAQPPERVIRVTRTQPPLAARARAVLVARSRLGPRWVSGRTRVVVCGQPWGSARCYSAPPSHCDPEMLQGEPAASRSRKQDDRSSDRGSRCENRRERKELVSSHRDVGTDVP